MSSIPPNSNIIGTIMQSQISAKETARKEDAKKNRRAQQSREIARLAEQQQDEVENTQETQEAIVHRQDERQHDGQDARHTWQQHEMLADDGRLYTPNGETPPVVDEEETNTYESNDSDIAPPQSTNFQVEETEIPPKEPPKDQSPPADTGHIDFSA